MNNTSSWLTRAGSLLVIVGFFLPSVAVSCTVLPAAEQAFSLSDLAGQARQPLLYLVLLGALAALIASFVPVRTAAQNFAALMVQAAGLGLGVLGMLGSLLSLSDQISEAGFLFSSRIEFGFLVLLLGYGLAGTGVLIGFGQRMSAPPLRQPPDIGPSGMARPGHAPVHAPTRGPRLEVVRGAVASPIPIDSPDFSIGRSRRSHLVLSDRLVSGLHVRLRYAQGSWFIQDQSSSNGTFVNGRRVTAQKLNEGDQVKIGETTFVFRS